MRSISGALQAIRARFRPPSSPARPGTGESGLLDLERHVEVVEAIPGMLHLDSCRLLYALCYTQTLRGDVVEIGSWQGRSTTFLARAALDARNGSVHAVDHFQGNVGRESSYVVGRNDLSDLKQGFLANLERLGMTDVVTLHDMPSGEAARMIPDGSLRFLFIDGDHSAPGVRADILTYWPKLKPGGLLLFDDYAAQFPGVVDTVNDLVRKVQPPRAFVVRHLAVVTLPGEMPAMPL